MKNTKLLSTLLNASTAAFFNSLTVDLWTNLAPGFSPAVAVLVAQLLCLSRHTKQQREGRLNRSLLTLKFRWTVVILPDWGSSSSLEAAVTFLVLCFFIGSGNSKGSLLVE